VLENEVWLKLGALLVFFLVVPKMLAVLSVPTQPARAYVDPDSEPFAFQILSNIVAGAVYFIRKGPYSLFSISHIIPTNEALNQR
jgi:hypothetical protein